MNKWIVTLSLFLAVTAGSSWLSAAYAGEGESTVPGVTLGGGCDGQSCVLDCHMALAPYVEGLPAATDQGTTSRLAASYEGEGESTVPGVTLGVGQSCALDSRMAMACSGTALHAQADDGTASRLAAFDAGEGASPVQGVTAGLGCGDQPCAVNRQMASAPPAAAQDQAQAPAAQAYYYTFPMHPEVKSDKPGDCPKCGMALVKKVK